MYNRCYYFKNKMYVNDIIPLINKYPEYNVLVFNKTGIIINDTIDRIAIEGYYFNS